VPIRSFLESDAGARLLKGTPFAVYVCCRRYWSVNFKAVKKLATKQGGEYVDNIHFTYEGGQVRSLAALLSCFAKGENVPRYLGLKIPPTNLQPDYEEATRGFAEGLASSVARRSTCLTSTGRNCRSRTRRSRGRSTRRSTDRSQTGT
jgi:hypothetical protein